MFPTCAQPNSNSKFTVCTRSETASHGPTQTSVAGLVNTNRTQEQDPTVRLSSCIKVRPRAVLLFTPFRSQLTLLTFVCPTQPAAAFAALAGSLALTESGRWRARRTLDWLRRNGTGFIIAEIRYIFLSYWFTCTMGSVPIKRPCADHCCFSLY